MPLAPALEEAIGQVPIVVHVTRDAFSQFFNLEIETGPTAGSTEELEIEEAKEWFKARGASMPAVEKALDYVWNFYGYRKPVRIKINNPTPPPRNSRVEPRV